LFDLVGYKPMAVAEVVDSEVTQSLDLKGRWSRVIRTEDEPEEDDQQNTEITEDDIAGNNYEEENYFKFLNELEEKLKENIQYVINDAKTSVDQTMAAEFTPKKEDARKASIAPARTATPKGKKGGSADKKKGKGKAAPEPEPEVTVSTPALSVQEEFQIKCRDLKTKIYKDQLLSILQEIYKVTQDHFGGIVSEGKELLSEVNQRWQAETVRLQKMLVERAELEKKGAGVLDRFLAEVIEDGVSFPFKIDFSSEECLLKYELYVHKDQEVRKNPSELEDEDQIDSYKVNKNALVANLDARYNCFINKHDLRIMLGAYNLEIVENDKTENQESEETKQNEKNLFNSMPHMLNWRLLLEKDGLDESLPTNFKNIRDLQLLDPASMLAKRCERIEAGICESEEYKDRVSGQVEAVINMIKQFKLKVINE